MGQKTAAFEISHGAGVAIGMVMITQHAESIGLSPKGTTAQINRNDQQVSFAYSVRIG